MVSARTGIPVRELLDHTDLDIFDEMVRALTQK